MLLNYHFASFLKPVLARLVPKTIYDIFELTVAHAILIIMRILKVEVKLKFK